MLIIPDPVIFGGLAAVAFAEARGHDSMILQLYAEQVMRGRQGDDSGGDRCSTLTRTLTIILT